MNRECDFSFCYWFSNYPINNEIIIVAKQKDQIIGVISTKNIHHISLLFVDDQFWKQGIAKTLLNKLLDNIKMRDSSAEFISVNSSLFAESYYAKIGFVKQEEMKEIDGIKFVPMMLRI